MINLPVVTALNDTTYVAITLTADTPAWGFMVHTDDASAFYLALDDSGTGVQLIPEKYAPVWNHYEAVGTTVVYAKSVTGTPNLVLNPGKAN